MVKRECHLLDKRNNHPYANVSVTEPFIEFTATCEHKGVKLGNARQDESSEDSDDHVDPYVMDFASDLDLKHPAPQEEPAPIQRVGPTPKEREVKIKKVTFERLPELTVKQDERKALRRKRKPLKDLLRVGSRAHRVAVPPIVVEEASELPPPRNPSKKESAASTVKPLPPNLKKVNEDQAPAKVIKSKDPLVKDFTEAKVYLFTLESIKDLAFMEKVKLWVASVVRRLPTGSTVGRSASKVVVTNNVVVSNAFGVWGVLKDERVRDELRALGYNTCTLETIYPALYERLMKTSEPLPRALDGNGKPSPALLDQLKACVRRNQGAFVERAAWEFVHNTIRAVFQALLIQAARNYGMTGALSTIYSAPGGVKNVVVDRGLYKMRHTDPTKGYEFEDNGKFLRSGYGWLPDGQLDISLLEPPRKFPYNVIPGPHFPTSVEVHRESPAHIRDMLHRLTGRRKAKEYPGLDALLTENQIKNVGPDFFKFLKDLMHESVIDVPTEFFERAEQTVVTAGDKQAIYRRTLEMIRDKGMQASEMVRNNEAKLKREKAKAGKYSRCFVNLSVQSTLDGGAYLKALKSGLSKNPIEVREEGKCIGLIHFVAKTSRRNLNRWASRIHQRARQQVPVLFVHSDDASLVVGMRIFNIDISGCDSSHGPNIFAAFGQLFQDQEGYNTWLGQLMRPLRIAYQGDWIRAALYPLQPFLASGHVFTTFLNTVCLMAALRPLFYKEAQKAGYIQVGTILDEARFYGYHLTVEHCHHQSMATFLKHWVDAEGRAAPCFGVLLRAIGMYTGEMKGVGTNRAKARAYAYSIINSFMHGICVPFLEEWKANFAPCKDEVISALVRKDFEYKRDFSEEQDPGHEIDYFSDVHFLERYERHYAGLSSELVAVTKKMMIGNSYHSKATETVFRIDYGLKPLTEDYPDTPWIGYSD